MLMKVLLIGSHPAICGAAFSMLKLVEELEKLGVNVIPVTSKGFLHKLFEKNNRKHYTRSSWSWAISNNYSWMRELIVKTVKRCLNIYGTFQYVKLIKKENPDIIHVNVLTSYVPVVAGLKCHKPVVWHIREMMEEDLDSHFWNKEAAYVLMKKVNHFIAISECVKAKYGKIVGLDRITCIYNGVDVERFYNPNHEILNKNSVIVTLAGRICRLKGQLQCLIDMAPILKKYPNMILQFAGVGREHDIQKILEKRHQMDLDEKQVNYLGYVEKMESLWAQSDIAIVYSKFEAFGRVTVEAKMAGALVVGYNSGGTTELIEDGQDGYLFGNGYPSLPDVVEKILSDRFKSSQIANIGRIKAAEMFTSRRNAEQVLDVYRNVLDR